jgi:uncharacterized protein (DUF4415 family)
MKKTIQYETDLADPPALTSSQQAELRALDLRPESKIDYSDIPPLDDAFWKNAVRNPFYKPTKTSTTVRTDSDALLWLRTHGKGYQSRIKAILRTCPKTGLHHLILKGTGFSPYINAETSAALAAEGSPPIGVSRVSGQVIRREMPGVSVLPEQNSASQ